ncbi:hypothetical protein H8356DRAFT_1424214 [Neocallimastix lanati (nom. inval.)]|nr:hypothetical protein H8356DRAFT_1424214 [Neocallimastix sp. JGI-2020a]
MSEMHLYNNIKEIRKYERTEKKAMKEILVYNKSNERKAKEHYSLNIKLDNTNSIAFISSNDNNNDDKYYNNIIRILDISVYPLLANSKDTTTLININNNSNNQIYKIESSSPSKNINESYNKTDSQTNISNKNNNMLNQLNLTKDILKSPINTLSSMILKNNMIFSLNKLAINFPIKNHDTNQYNNAYLINTTIIISDTPKSLLSSIIKNDYYSSNLDDNKSINDSSEFKN